MATNPIGPDAAEAIAIEQFNFMRRNGQSPGEALVALGAPPGATGPPTWDDLYDLLFLHAMDGVGFRATIESEHRNVLVSLAPRDGKRPEIRSDRGPSEIAPGGRPGGLGLRPRKRVAGG